ncbi:MAG: hypothetical protein H3C58_00730 [Fimbriimonadaceae bacterium]|nr:hypothetical protein [Fimbriimonadaceae bacterium]
MAEEHDGPENLSEPPAFFPKDLAGDYEVRGGDLLQVRVDGVFGCPSSSARSKRRPSAFRWMAPGRTAP